MSSCLVCQEVSGAVAVPGGPLQSGEFTLAFHVPPLDGGDAYLGHLLVVPRRHVPDFADLDGGEASELGVFMSRSTRALKRAGAERVYVATIGHSFDHLHVHLLPRWPGTPAEVPWHSVDEWSGARRVDFPEAALFVAQMLTDFEE
jgi:histidine triad (HIT) family protein